MNRFIQDDQQKYQVGIVRSKDCQNPWNRIDASFQSHSCFFSGYDSWFLWLWWSWSCWSQLLDTHGAKGLYSPSFVKFAFEICWFGYCRRDWKCICFAIILVLIFFITLSFGDNCISQMDEKTLFYHQKGLRYRSQVVPFYGHIKSDMTDKW